MLKGSLPYYGQSRKIAILMTRLISRMLITCPFDPDTVVFSDFSPISRGHMYTCMYKMKVGFFASAYYFRRESS